MSFFGFLFIREEEEEEGWGANTTNLIGRCSFHHETYFQIRVVVNVLQWARSKGRNWTQIRQRLLNEGSLSEPLVKTLDERLKFGLPNSCPKFTMMLSCAVILAVVFTRLTVTKLIKYPIVASFLFHKGRAFIVNELNEAVIVLCVVLALPFHFQRVCRERRRVKKRRLAQVRCVHRRFAT